eukprot:363952-Chlamydomonas_euryale.AAC.4
MPGILKRPPPRGRRAGALARSAAAAVFTCRPKPTRAAAPSACNMAVLRDGSWDGWRGGGRGEEGRAAADQRRGRSKAASCNGGAKTGTASVSPVAAGQAASVACAQSHHTRTCSSGPDAATTVCVLLLFCHNISNPLILLI